MVPTSHKAPGNRGFFMVNRFRPTYLASNMTRFAIFFLLLAGLMTGCFTPSSPEPPIVLDAPFNVASVRFPNDTVYNRANLNPIPNGRVRLFLEKCATRGTVRLGFIGGSITAGAITTTQSRRYSSLLASYIKQAYPGLKSVVEINAGIGSTGSRYAASRAAEDLLAQSPDLIVIEFAVNDFVAGSDAYIRATLEGLVRQCLLHAADVPVLLLFTAKGDGQNVQALHAAVGDHYALPMISYRDAIWPLIDSNRMSWNDVFHDDPHPNDNGHRIAAHLLYTYLKKAAGQSATAGITVPPPLYSDLYQYAGVVTTGDTAVQATLSGWQAIAGDKGRTQYQSSGSGTSTLTLRTARRELTIGLHMHGSQNSNIRVLVEGGGLDTVLSDSYPFEHTRLFQVFARDDALPVAMRTVRIEHQGSAAFKLDYVLYAGQPQ
jgi:lysophospholipase L1-like esterase